MKLSHSRPKITPCLWFDGDAEAAVEHYLSIFASGRVIEMSRCGDSGPGPKGSVLTAVFELEGQRLMALNGGPYFKFSEAISMVIDCDSQTEVDHFWERLGEGGQPSRCGWLKDKFGLSWQIVPRRLVELLTGPDAAASGRVMSAMMKMSKIEIAALEAAAANT